MEQAAEEEDEQKEMRKLLAGCQMGVTTDGAPSSGSIYLRRRGPDRYVATHDPHNGGHFGRRGGGGSADTGRELTLGPTPNPSLQI